MGSPRPAPELLIGLLNQRGFRYNNPPLLHSNNNAYQRLSGRRCSQFPASVFPVVLMTSARGYPAAGQLKPPAILPVTSRIPAAAAPGEWFFSGRPDTAATTYQIQSSTGGHGASCPAVYPAGIQWLLNNGCNTAVAPRAG